MPEHTARAPRTSSSRKNPQVLEGFAGPGGWSEAARMIGLHDVLGIELNADACATATAAGHRRLHADIRDLNPEDLIGVVGWISSPPCPTYTAAGLRSGIADQPHVLEGCTLLGDSYATGNGDHQVVYRQVTDERTALVLETLHFAFRLPDVQWVVAEQVPAVSPIWMDMAAELAMAADFTSCNVLTLRADDFGAATRRKRTFLIATRNRDPNLARMPIREWWACGRFEPPHQRMPHPVTPLPATSMAKALGWPAAVRINTRGDRRTPGGNEFSADRPAPSLTSRARTWYRTDLGPAVGRLTPSQAGLLQGFPPDYPWQGSRTSQFQQVADTVSPLFGAAVLGAVTGLPWQDAVWARLADLYGHERPAEPQLRSCMTDAGQLDLFAEVA